MSLFVKIWTDCLQDEWFLNLKLIERGMFFMLIILAKFHGDSGGFSFRTWHGLADSVGADAETSRKILRFFHSENRVILTESKNLVRIEICNYIKWQTVDAKEATKNQRKTNGKSHLLDIDIDKIKEKKSIVEASPDYQPAVDYFCTQFKKDNGNKYHFTAKDGKNIKVILNQYGLEKFKEFTDRFIASDDPFILKAGKTISVMLSQINKLSQEPNKAKDYGPSRIF